MKIFFTLLILVGSVSNQCIAASTPGPKRSHDSIIVQKNSLKRTHRFQLYPDASQKVLFFNVRGYSGKVYQLFVFDMEGKVVKQAEIRSKQTTLITGIEKGNYLFEVLSDDDRIGNGQIAVR